MIYQTIEQLKHNLAGVLTIDGEDVGVTDADRLRDVIVDDLIYSAIFSPDDE